MPIVGGLDIHRKQITFDYLDTVRRLWHGGRSPADVTQRYLRPEGFAMSSAGRAVALSEGAPMQAATCDSSTRRRCG